VCNVRDRTYGQFCGLARAAEVLGQRWTMLVLRDLLVAPRRYSELLEGLPGIPSNGLVSRLKELEDDGLVIRQIGSGPDRSVRYRATERARELIPAFDALGRWGAAAMRQPRAGEVVTEASLVTALRSAVRPKTRSRSRRPVVYEVRVDDATAHAVIDKRAVIVNPGSHPTPDLTLHGGPGFRDILAGEIDPDSAVKQGAVRLHGDTTLFPDFVSTFHVPYSADINTSDLATQRPQ
jgi:DNA-binding HxlR family transcriptional regulator